ncbi:MAG: nucleotidyltransferase domain-containing protein [Chloroflexota bacterium]
MAIKATLQNLHYRDTLALDIISHLQRDERVISVRLQGSLANGTADRYSDIDLCVQLRDVSDRAFAEILPDLIRPVGKPFIEGWGVGFLPDLYIRTVYFDAYPLFWHVDIACESNIHIDGHDLRNTYHWPQIFKIWIDVVSDWLRGKDSTARLEQIISRWHDIHTVKDAPPNTKLIQYLEWCTERARKRGAPCDTLSERCQQLCDDYL